MILAIARLPTANNTKIAVFVKMEIRWIDVKEQPPLDGRYFVLVRCHSGMHMAVVRNWTYPCCASINIAYFSSFRGWEWSSNQKMVDSLRVTHYALIPRIPREILKSNTEPNP